MYIHMYMYTLGRHFAAILAKNSIPSTIHRICPPHPLLSLAEMAAKAAPMAAPVVGEAIRHHLCMHKGGSPNCAVSYIQSLRSVRWAKHEWSKMLTV